MSDYETQIQELEKENRLMRQLATSEGFEAYYFKMLGSRTKDGKNRFNTVEECFNHCNETYYDLFGNYRYSSYNSFRHKFNKRKN